MKRNFEKESSFQNYLHCLKRALKFQIQKLHSFRNGVRYLFPCPNGIYLFKIKGILTASNYCDVAFAIKTDLLHFGVISSLLQGPVPGTSNLIQAIF